LHVIIGSCSKEANTHVARLLKPNVLDISNKLQVGISTCSSKDNFYKHVKGMKLEFNKDRWKINFENSNL
jgi:hypothetical protein